MGSGLSLSALAVAGAGRLAAGTWQRRWQRSADRERSSSGGGAGGEKGGGHFFLLLFFK